MKNVAKEIQASFANLGTDKKLGRMVDELGSFSQRFTPRGASKMSDIQGSIDHLNTTRRDAPLGKTHANFQEWFKAKDFYMTLIFQHGDRLFDRDGDRYRIITVHIAFEAWKV